jgi:hypothetical protein
MPLQPAEVVEAVLRFGDGVKTALNLSRQVQLNQTKLRRCIHLNWTRWGADVLVVVGLDDDGLAEGERVGAKVWVVGDAAAERKKDNVMEVVAAAAAAVSPMPGTVVSDDTVAVAAAGVCVTDNGGVPMCCWIAGGTSIEVTTRALGSCSLTRICCCP